MPRPRNAFPAKKLHVAVPGELGSRLDLILYSEAEQRIPFASHQRFIVDRIREYFERDALDLALYRSDLPPESIVYGPRLVIEALKKILGGEE
jgi:hypothetical protein